LVAGIINIGTAHLGEFCGRDGICRAKSEIYTLLQMAHQLFLQPMILLINSPSSATEQVLSGAGGEIFATEIESQAQSATFAKYLQVMRQVNFTICWGA
jgi:UDP-N-acetylmuramoyl-tripeptide--D-alanyl-D-alanine ligase